MVKKGGHLHLWLDGVHSFVQNTEKKKNYQEQLTQTCLYLLYLSAKPHHRSAKAGQLSGS